MQFYVPTIKNSESASELKNAILTSEPNAKVEIDPESQTVTINSQASEATFKQLITATGHELG